MSTEQKHVVNPTEPKHEPNALAKALSEGWGKFKQGQLLSYPMMAILLLVIAGIGVTWWILHERRIAESARWVEYDGLSTVKSLEAYIEKHPNTIQAKLARLEIARIHLGPEGMDQMFIKQTDIRPTLDQDPAVKAREIREKAIANVEKAREEFAVLADEFKDDPVLHVECLIACAKAEAVLIGIPKEGQTELLQFRGTPEKAIEWLDKVVKAAPGTVRGASAEKLANTLRNQNTAQQVSHLHKSLIDLTPSLPPFDPKIPIAP